MSFTKIRAGIYRWTDTCNVYVIRDGESAIIIDLGDGSVLDALDSIGVKQVDWVLFTRKIQAAADAAPGLHLAAFDITRDGQRHGELFDFIAHVGRLDPALDSNKPGTERPSY